MDKEKFIEKSANLIQKLRKELGSLTLQEIQEFESEVPQLSDEEWKQRANDAEIFYKNYFEKVIKAFKQLQLRKIGEEGINESQIQFSRGTLNGIYLIEQWFKEQVSISKERLKPKEKIELGEI